MIILSTSPDSPTYEWASSRAFLVLGRSETDLGSNVLREFASSLKKAPKKEFLRSRRVQEVGESGCELGLGTLRKFGFKMGRPLMGQGLTHTRKLVWLVVDFLFAVVS